jgi:hypothetical protein
VRYDYRSMFACLLSGETRAIRLSIDVRVIIQEEEIKVLTCQEVAIIIARMSCDVQHI